MVKLMWEEEFVFHLIEKVQKNEFMWNFRTVGYRNKNKKQKFLMHLADEMNAKFNPNAPFTYELLLKKWNNLKSYYSVENQKYCKAQRNGADRYDLDNLQTSWKYKSRLDFLSTLGQPDPSVNNLNKRHLKDSQSESNVNLSSGISSSAAERSDTSTPASPTNLSHSMGSDDDMTRAESGDPSQLNSHSIPGAFSFVPVHTKKKPRTTRALAELIETSKDLTQALSKSMAGTSTQTVGNSAFGACIAAELDKLPTRLQIEGKKLIFNVMMDLQAEVLQQKDDESNG